LARAGTAYSAKILCSGVLMAGIDANRLKREDLALAQGLIKPRSINMMESFTLGLSLDLCEAKLFDREILVVVKRLTTAKSSDCPIKQKVKFQNQKQ
jgi:hypothetical protein